MSIGFLVDPEQALIWRGPMVTGALIQLLRDVEWGELDYLVLDLPPGTGDVPLSLAQNVKAAGVVLVSTPQDVALADVIRAKLMFDKVSIPILGLVENMSSFVCPHCRQETAIFDHGGARRPPRRWGSASSARSRSTSPSARAATRACRSSRARPTARRRRRSSPSRATWRARFSAQVLKAPRLPVIGAQPRA